MGNNPSNKRDRICSSELDSPCSPTKEENTFEYGIENQRGRFLYQSSVEEDDTALPCVKDKFSAFKLRSDTEDSTSSEVYQFPCVFRWDDGGKSVFVSGTFSNWEPIPMVESQGEFALILNVPEGYHQYKFKVDGQWIHAPNQPTVDNDLGTKNNVLWVKKSDFEVFEALADDSKNATSGGSALHDNPDESFSNSPPSVRNRNVVPPNLPPHLLEVILNKDVAINNEPILLPEPNHVMLNHLYALSIKDGVMVLSATLRYKKKYVTTVFYKTI